MNPEARTLRLAGDRIRQVRMERGLTRERLAQLSRGSEVISTATIKRAERGDPVYAGSAAALARLLQVPLASLLVQGRALGETARAAPITLAVLPFTTGELGEQGQAFADGLVDDLTQRLGYAWFPVIARCSSFSFRGQAADASEIGRALDADYLVEGSVHARDGRVRINVRTVEARTRQQVGSRDYDEALSQVFALQDRVAAEIVSQVGGTVLEREALRNARRSSAELDAWQLALRGLWRFHRSTQSDNREARALCMQALARDPSIDMCRYLVVLSHQHDLLQQWTNDPAATRREMRTAAREFEAVSPGSPSMYLATAYAAVAHGERNEAISRLEEALDLAPNSFAAHSLYGQVLAMSSQPDQGLHELDLARKLSPCDPKLWTVVLCMSLSHFVAGRYADAVQWAELAVRKRPHVAYCHAALAVAHAQLGDIAAAQTALRQAAERNPELGMAGFVPSFAATNPEIVERFTDGLRRAGLSVRFAR